MIEILRSLKKIGIKPHTQNLNGCEKCPGKKALSANIRKLYPDATTINLQCAPAEGRCGWQKSRQIRFSAQIEDRGKTIGWTSSQTYTCPKERYSNPRCLTPSNVGINVYSIK